MRISW